MRVRRRRGRPGENRIDTAYQLDLPEVRQAGDGACGCGSASDIPQAAGLGSSAAADDRRRAPLRGGDARSARCGRSCSTLATELEGHPDNAAAALLGGITLSCQTDDGGIIARSWRWPEAIRLVVATPEAGLETAARAARAAGRRCRSRDAVVQPAARAAAGARAARPAATTICARRWSDRWHQPARAPLVPGLARSARARRSGGPRRVPERRRPVDRWRSPRRPAPKKRRRCSATSTSGWACRVRSECWRRINPAPLARRENTVMNFSLRCHLCQTDFPADRALGLRQVPRPARGHLRLRRDRAAGVARADREPARRTSGAIASCCRSSGEPRTGLHSGFTPLVRADRLAERLGVRELYVKDDSVNHPTCSYKDRVVSVAATRAVELGFTVFACASTGNLAGSVASHAARLGLVLLRLHPRRSRSRQGRRRQRLPPAHHRRPRQLRRREPAVHAGGGQVQLGLREHQPARLLRRRRQDLRVRDRRTARLALPAPRRLAGRRRHAAAAHPQGLRGAADRRPGRRRAAGHPRRAGGRLRAGRPRARGRPRVPRSGQAEHDRQVDCDRQSGRRLPGAALGARDRRLRRDGRRRRDHRGHSAAGRNRRHLHRAGRRRHGGGDAAS